jgi:hypothetical protein
VKWDAPHRIGGKCPKPSPPREELGRPSEEWNEMSELLTASQLDVGTPHCARVKWDAPHRSGGKSRTPSPPGRSRDAPQSIGMKCRNPSLRPNEMSQLLTASEWSGVHHRIGGKRPNPSPPGEAIRCRSGHRNQMSELLTASQLDVGTPHRARVKWDAPHRSGGKSPNPSPLREEMGCPSERRSEMSDP